MSCPRGTQDREGGIRLAQLTLGITSGVAISSPAPTLKGVTVPCCRGQGVQCQLGKEGGLQEPHCPRGPEEQ